ncbi:TetR/AcrR family transcriptional regulator [Pendulispora albinea]|uniref:TetR/AcrR family transcriptional regulator n=1 Tax=Pendulispora albinea TaxID=2741071 RepID=A0ABZ2LMJ2_9BACT
MPPKTASKASPKTPPRRRLLPDARRAELIEVAIRLMRERGDASPTIADVTAAAGAAKGTFYLYFDNWDELVLAIRDHFAAGWKEDVLARAARNKKSTWHAFLDLEAARFVDALVAMGPLHQAIFHGPAAFRQAGTNSPAVALLAQLLEQGARDGAFDVDDPQATASLLFGAWHAAGDAIDAGGDRERHLGALRHLMRKWL